MSLKWIKCKTCNRKFYSYGANDLKCRVCISVDDTSYSNSSNARCPKCKEIICCDDKHESFDYECDCGHDFHIQIDYEKTVTSPDLLD